MESGSVYTEERRLSAEAQCLLALPFALAVCALIAVNVLVPLLAAARIVIFGVMLLEATIGVALNYALSRCHITIDDQTLTVAFRILFKSRTALDRIVACEITNWRGWGMQYRPGKREYGTRHHFGGQPIAPSGPRAVRLILANDAQLLFGTHHPDEVCAILYARCPSIAIA